MLIQESLQEAIWQFIHLVMLNAGEVMEITLFCFPRSGNSHYIMHIDQTKSLKIFGLQAYDQHLNMILGDVEEVVTTVEIDDETYEEIVRVCIYLSYTVIFFAFKYQNDDIFFIC